MKRNRRQRGSCFMIRIFSANGSIIYSAMMGNCSKRRARNAAEGIRRRLYGYSCSVAKESRKVVCYDE